MAGISPSLFKFLTDLGSNNNKEWFDTHKSRYQEEEKKFKMVCSEILTGLQQTDQIEKMKVYRIYKDVRFSKDKTPYKTHRSANFTREGEALRGGYFIKVSPEKSLMGGGFFMPNPSDLLRIRKEFDLDDEPIRSIMRDKKFAATFGTKFVPYNQVKTAPKGFSKEHPSIDLIRNKSFFFEHEYATKEVFADNFSQQVVTHFKLLRPYFDYMSEVLTTNLNGESLI